MSIPMDFIKQSGEKKADIPFFACAEHDGKLYFSSWLINGFCSLDLSSGQVFYYMRFENECEEQHLHAKAITYKNEIWFIPCKGKYISIVDIQTKEITSMELPDADQYQYKFWTAAVVTNRKYLWLIPWKYGELLKINMETKSIDHIQDNPVNYIHKTEETYFVDAVKVKNDIWLFSQEAKEIYIYDTIEEKTRTIPWGHGKDRVNKLIYAGEAVWFFPTKLSSSIVKKDIFTGEESCFALPKENLEKLSERCYIAEYLGDWIWMAPFEGRNFIRIHIHSGKIEEIDELHRKACLSQYPYERFQTAYKTEERLFFLSDKEGTAMFCYHKDSGRVTFYELSLSWKEYAKYLVIKADCPLSEETVRLPDFMQGMMQRKLIISHSLNRNRINSIGDRIWDALRGGLDMDKGI